MDASMRRVLADDDSGQDGRDGDGPALPLYVRSHAHTASAPPPAAAAGLAGARTETATPPLPPTAPASSTPSRRRTNSTSSTGASHYGASSSNSSHRLKSSGYHRSERAASGSNATGGTSASPHVALEPPSTPSSIAAALGNASVADTTPSDTAAGDNRRNTATMLSDSAFEHEIAEFGRILDDMLARVTHRELVKKTAEYMKAHPQHSVRFQIKIKQRAFCESVRQFQAKLMLFYVLHEFLKSFHGDELRNIQREWFQTVDDILHACVRDMRNIEDGRKRIFKTLARWEELKLYTQKIKGWKSLVMGEVKPRRGPVRLPRSEAERLAEVPDQLQQFPPPPSAPQIQIDRTTYPYLFERSDFVTKYELKQHWRYTAIAFIDVLSQCLLLNRDVSLTASLFFHRVFDRGIYAKERFKVAAACIFLAAKASSKRMKLLRMVRTMHEILESPLMVGDEEILDLERMQLLYYEIEVLQGINFDLTTEMPFFYLRRTLEQMPEKFRRDVMNDSNTVLEDLFWLPMCLTISPHFLAEAAAYIACRNNGRVFSFKWCIEDAKGVVLTERLAKEVLKEYRAMMEWKKGQRINHETLSSTAGSAGGSGPRSLKEVFQSQQGGLRIDATLIQVESEYTKRGVNESKDIIVTNVGGSRGRSDDAARGATSSASRSARSSWRDDSDVKDESRSSSSRYDDRDWSRSSRSGGGSSSSRYDTYNSSSSSSRKSRDHSDERDRRRSDRSPRRGDYESEYRSRDREYDRRSRRSHSASPRGSSSLSSRKRKRTTASSSSRRSESRSPSRSHSRERRSSSSYYSRTSSSDAKRYSRDRSDYRSDRKPQPSSRSSSSSLQIKRESSSAK